MTKEIRFIKILKNNRGHPQQSGHSNSPSHISWKNMLARCYNPSSKDYLNYSGKNIRVCERWRRFLNFLADMGERPKGMTLDRIDNQKGYYKENCRWSDSKTQSMNKGPKKNSSSKYKGVLFNPKNSKINPWIAKIGFLEKTIYLGVFKTEREAALAYNKAAKEYYGEKTWINNLEEQE